MARSEAPFPIDPELRDQVRQVTVIQTTATGRFAPRAVAEYIERKAASLEERVLEAKVTRAAGAEALAQYLVGRSSED